MSAEPDLGQLDDLIQVVWDPQTLRPRGSSDEGSVYCPKCGDRRRVRVSCLYSSDEKPRMPVNAKKSLTPSLYLLACVQCRTVFTSLVYWGPDGTDLVVLPSVRGGLTTPNTPGGVAYYLDQAYRAQAVGARSASLAMYRGALEQFLFTQAFHQDRLANKLKALDDAIQQGRAPVWATDLDVQFLDLIRELGNGAIHPNDGDVAKQAAIDDELLTRVGETFRYLIYIAYEVPFQKTQLLGTLQARARALKKQTP